MASIIAAMISNALAAGAVEIWPTVDTSVVATIAEMGTASFDSPTVYIVHSVHRCCVGRSSKGR